MSERQLICATRPFAKTASAVLLCLVVACGPNFVARGSIEIDRNQATINSDLDRIDGVVQSIGFVPDHGTNVGAKVNSSVGMLEVMAGYELATDVSELRVAIFRQQNAHVRVVLSDIRPVVELSGPACEKYLVLVNRLKEEFGASRVNPKIESCSTELK